MAFSIKGGHSFRMANGTRKLMFATSEVGQTVDVLIYNSSTDSWDKQGRAYTAGSTPEFLTYLDRVFAFNINDATESYDGSTWSTSVQVTSAPKAKYGIQYFDRIYLAYVDVVGTTHYSRVAYSSIPDTSGNITWNPTVDYFDVALDDGDILRGLGENANRLLIFKEDSLYRYDLNQLFKIPAAPGTSSSRTIKNILGKTIYLHRSGIWLYDGDTSSLISRPVQDFIEGISSLDLPNTCAWVEGDYYKIFIGNVNNADTKLVVNNCVLSYNVSQKVWASDSLAHTINVGVTHVDDSSDVTYSDPRYSYSESTIGYSGYTSAAPEIYLGTDDGYVMQASTGNSHAGTAIAMNIETKSYYPGNPSTDKYFHKALFYSKRGTSTSVAFKTDVGPWITLGQLYAPVSEFEFPEDTRGKKIQFKYKESSTQSPPEVQGFDIYFRSEAFI